MAFTDLPGFLEATPRAVTPAVAARGNTETALVLALRPELARPGRAEEGFVGNFDQEAQALIFREGLQALTPNGILGDARRGRGAGPGLPRRAGGVPGGVAAAGPGAAGDGGRDAR